MVWFGLPLTMWSGLQFIETKIMLKKKKNVPRPCVVRSRWVTRMSPHLLSQMGQHWAVPKTCPHCGAQMAMIPTVHLMNGSNYYQMIDLNHHHLGPKWGAKFLGQVWSGLQEALSKLSRPYGEDGSLSDFVNSSE